MIGGVILRHIQRKESILFLHITQRSYPAAREPGQTFSVMSLLTWSIRFMESKLLVVGLDHLWDNFFSV